MKLWLHNLIFTTVSTVGDSIAVYFALHLTAPEALMDTKVWKGMGVFIAYNALKTLSVYLKNPPSPPKAAKE